MSNNYISAHYVCIIAIYTSVIACIMPHLLTRLFQRGLPLLSTLSAIGHGGLIERFIFSLFLAISGIFWFFTTLIHFTCYIIPQRSFRKLFGLSISTLDFFLTLFLGFTLGALAAIEHNTTLHLITTAMFFVCSSTCCFLTSLRIRHCKDSLCGWGRLVTNWLLYATILPFAGFFLVGERFIFSKYRAFVFPIFEHLFVFLLLYFNHKYTVQDLKRVRLCWHLIDSKGD
ncbi:hypothetical protein P9112_001054 [Eukaryota sp. TZLM1-RC]